MAEQQPVSCFSVDCVAGVYDEIYLARIFIPWARLLLERAALRPGEAVLDIATGPGTVARLGVGLGVVEPHLASVPPPPNPW